MFETLESALEFSSEAFAAVRIMSGLNQTLAGRRVGPYYVCARRKFGSRDYVRVIFDTRAEFIGPGGQKSEFPEEDSREIRETLMGVRILAAKSPEYFPYDCPAGKQGLVTE